MSLRSLAAVNRPFKVATLRGLQPEVRWSIEPVGERAIETSYVGAHRIRPASWCRMVWKSRLNPPWPLLVSCVCLSKWGTSVRLQSFASSGRLSVRPLTPELVHHLSCAQLGQEALDGQPNHCAAGSVDLRLRAPCSPPHVFQEGVLGFVEVDRRSVQVSPLNRRYVLGHPGDP